MDGRVITKEFVRVPVSIEEAQKYRLDNGDILFNTRNSAELVGKTGIVHGAPPGAVYNNNLMRIRVGSDLDPRFLAWQMIARPFRNKLEGIKRATTSVAAIYAKDLLPLRIVVAPIHIQREVIARIENSVGAIDRTADEIDTQLVRAARLRQSILKRAFEGKLVPKDPDDEPAAVLLDRIRAERSTETRALRPRRSRGSRARR